MIKKIGTFLLATSLAFGLWGCGQQEPPPDGQTQHIDGYSFTAPKGYTLMTGQKEPDWSYVIYTNGKNTLSAVAKYEEQPALAIKDDRMSWETVMEEENGAGKIKPFKVEKRKGFYYTYGAEKDKPTACGIEFRGRGNSVITITLERDDQSPQADTGLTEKEMKQFDGIVKSVKKENGELDLGGEERKMSDMTVTCPKGYTVTFTSETDISYEKIGDEETYIEITAVSLEPVAETDERIKTEEFLESSVGGFYGIDEMEFDRLSICGFPALCASYDTDRASGATVYFKAGYGYYKAELTTGKLTRKTMDEFLQTLKNIKPAKR